MQSEFNTELAKRVNDLSAKDFRNIRPIYNQLISTLELQSRAVNALYDAGLVFVGDLVKADNVKLLQTPGIGIKTRNEIKNCLYRYNLELGTNVDDWMDVRPTLQAGK